MRILFPLLFIFIITTVQAQPCMNVEISKQNPSCIGLSDGSASAIVSGGTSPYTYSWSTGAPTNSISNLSAGNYSVTISDAANCTITANFTIEHAPVVNITANTTSTCEGIPITFFATQQLGGNNPQYQWQVNGINAGTNTGGFVDSTLNNGDVVTVILTSNDTCVLINTDTSNAITINITSAQQPVITQNGNQLTTISASHHQWFFNGSPLPGDTTQTINISATGGYNVIITDSNGCQAVSDTFYISVIGINELNSKGILIYPIPAENIINIVLEKKLINAELHILNQTGEIIFHNYYDIFVNDVPIDVSELSSGIYFVKIKTETQQIHKKFIKN